MAHGEITNLCHAFVKRSGLGSHLGFKLVPKRKKYFFLHRIYHHCNSTASFQLDNFALCGDVHPNPGFDPEVSLIQDRNTQTISKRKNMLVHLNARSLLQHINELRLIFSKVFPPIIAITETWLENSIEDSEIAILNYSVERLDRKDNRRGGGNALFTGRPKIYSKKRFRRRLGSYLDSSTIMQNEFLGRMCLPRPKRIPGGF